MHPILRIFDYQTDASLSVIGSTTPYGQGGGLGTIRICEHDEVSDLSRRMCLSQDASPGIQR